MICQDFVIPNWEMYKLSMLELNSDDKNFELILGSNQEQNFMKFVSSATIENNFSNLHNYFKNIQLPIKFIVLFGTPPNKNCLDGIHKDSYPMEGYDASDYAINFSIDNTTNSSIVFFDNLKNEICRKNYDKSPILFRTDIFHSVINYSNTIRLTASLRFDKALNNQFKTILNS